MLEVTWSADNKKFDSDENLVQISAWLAALEGKEVLYQIHMSTTHYHASEDCLFIENIKLENNILNYNFKNEPPQNIQVNKLVITKNYKEEKLKVESVESDDNQKQFISFEEVKIDE